ncbi:MAG: branched-chain amino acid ABC transporter permease [Actinomycetes bacterium]|jgi:branched-chain amino acid transport system permease protein
MTATETRPQAATPRTLSTGARIGIGAAVVAATAALGMFGPPGIRSLTVLVMILSIYAVSYGVLLGFVDLPSLGQSLFFGVGAYCAILPLTRADWSLWAVLGTSLVVGLALAFVTGTVAVRLSEAYHVIVTALFGAVAQLAADNFTPITGGEGGLSARIPPLRLGPWEISVYDAVPAFLLYLAFAVVAFLLMYGLVRSPIGTVWKAIRDNQDRALSAGYNVYAYKLAAFAIVGMFTAFSGALYAVNLRYTSTEFLGIAWSVLPFLWVLIGGTGTLTGPIIGVAIYTVFQFYVSQLWTHYLIILGVVMIAVLRWAPQGIMGIVRPGSTRNLLARRAAPAAEGDSDE